MGSVFNIYDLILLLIAVFIGFRLIAILGVSQDIIPMQKEMKIVTPIEEDIQPKKKLKVLCMLKSCKDLVAPQENHVKYQLSENGINILNSIKESDKTFDLTRFIKVSIGIYSKVVYLVNKLNLQELDNYCTDAALKKIVEYVSCNKTKGFVVQQSLSNYHLIDLIDAHTKSGVQYITIKLEIHLIRAVFNQYGEMVSGDTFDPIISSDEITLSRRNEESQWKIDDLGLSLTSNEI